MNTGNWRTEAACLDSAGDEWFPPGRSTVNPMVLRICAGCPVWRDCLLYALAHPDVWHGIWAGLTAREIAALRNRMVSGELGADVVRHARKITENRGPVTLYYTAVPHPMPSRRSQRRQRHEATDALTAAGLLGSRSGVRSRGRAA